MAGPIKIKNVDLTAFPGTNFVRINLTPEVGQDICLELEYDLAHNLANQYRRDR